MKITELIAILLMTGVLLYLLWQLLRSREELRRECDRQIERYVSLRRH